MHNALPRRLLLLLRFLRCRPIIISTRQELSLVGAFVREGPSGKHIHVSICRAQILEEISHKNTTTRTQSSLEICSVLAISLAGTFIVKSRIITETDATAQNSNASRRILIVLLLSPMRCDDGKSLEFFEERKEGNWWNQ